MSIGTRLRLIAILVAAFLTPQPAVAQTVRLTREPYLQRATVTPGSTPGITVRWRTDLKTNTRLCHGPSASSLTACVAISEATTEHRVQLTGLIAARTYYYAVGFSSINGAAVSPVTLAGGTSGHYFKTAPAPGNPAPARLWVIGDSGTGFGRTPNVAAGNAERVRDAFLAFTQSRHTDVWLMVGDNAYALSATAEPPVWTHYGCSSSTCADGMDKTYQVRVFDTYRNLIRTIPLWPVLGNHDAPQRARYYDMFSLPQSGEAGGTRSMTEAYYAFDHGNIHIVALDSTSLTNLQPGSTMLTWLTSDLQAARASRKDWIIAVWHHAPYSKGSHDSDNCSRDPLMCAARTNMLPILRQHGVDLVLTGHSHSYERSWLDERPVNAVIGSSGKTEAFCCTEKHPKMPVRLLMLGSLVLDVDGRTLDATFLDAAGTRRDSFTLRKDQDTYISEFATNASFGKSTTLAADGSDPNARDLAALLRFDVSGCERRRVTRGTLTINVTNGSTGDYQAYEILRPWVETRTTWTHFNQAAGTAGLWQTAGAKGSLDRGALLGTVQARAAASYSLELPAAAIQAWVDNPSRNNGFIVANANVVDGLAFDSREGVIPPRLSVTCQ